MFLENISNDQPLETPSEIGLTEKETKRFSILRAINAMANPTDRKAQEDAAFEFECSRAAGELYGKTAQGVLLPPEVLVKGKPEISYVPFPLLATFDVLNAPSI